MWWNRAADPSLSMGHEHFGHCAILVKYNNWTRLKNKNNIEELTFFQIKFVFI